MEKAGRYGESWGLRRRCRICRHAVATGCLIRGGTLAACAHGAGATLCRKCSPKALPGTSPASNSWANTTLACAPRSWDSKGQRMTSIDPVAPAHLGSSIRRCCVCCCVAAVACAVCAANGRRERGRYRDMGLFPCSGDAATRHTYVGMTRRASYDGCPR